MVSILDNNLIIFIVIGSFTVVYLDTIQPSLINKKASNHIKIIDNTIDHIQRLKINFIEDKSIISGFIVKLGSTMIDFSMKSKLDKIVNSLR